MRSDELRAEIETHRAALLALKTRRDALTMLRVGLTAEAKRLKIERGNLLLDGAGETELLRNAAALDFNEQAQRDTDLQIAALPARIRAVAETIVDLEGAQRLAAVQEVDAEAAQLQQELNEAFALTNQHRGNGVYYAAQYTLRRNKIALEAKSRAAVNALSSYNREGMLVTLCE